MQLDEEGGGVDTATHDIDTELLDLYVALEADGQVVPGDPRTVTEQVEGGHQDSPYKVAHESKAMAKLLAAEPDLVGTSPFITRAQWQARAPKTPNSTNITPTGNTSHYEGPHMGWPWDHSRCPVLVRGIQAGHMDKNGWNDIAYSSVVCNHGYIYEGRWLGHRTAANGTDVSNQTQYAHCVLIGEGDAFTDAGKQGLSDVTEFFRHHGSGSRLYKHKDWFPTSCCGVPVSAFVDSGMHLPGGGSLPMGYPIHLPMLDVADWVEVDGYSWFMTPDGAVFAGPKANKAGPNVNGVLGVNGQPYFANKTAAQLHVRNENGRYVNTVWATDDSSYRPDGGPPFRVERV